MNTQTNVDLNDVLECLDARECAKGSEFLSPAAALRQWIAQEVSVGNTADDARATLARADEYFGAGYRLHNGVRQVFGLTHAVPADALAHRLVRAGDLAGSEAYRLQWITKK